MLVFIDCEYTHFIDLNLISIGLVAESGDTFYAEVPYPLEACSDFVRQAVLPLLGQVPGAACPAGALPSRLHTWLENVRPQTAGADPLQICYDSRTDWDLFADALDYAVPAWVRPRLVAGEISEQRRYAYYAKYGLPAHHALYDALANQYAYRGGVGTGVREVDM